MAASRLVFAAAIDTPLPADVVYATELFADAAAAIIFMRCR